MIRREDKNILISSVSAVHVIPQYSSSKSATGVRLASNTALQIHAVRLLGESVHESESGDLDRALRQSIHQYRLAFLPL